MIIKINLLQKYHYLPLLLFIKNAIIVHGYEATVIAYQLSIYSFMMYQMKMYLWVS